MLNLRRMCRAAVVAGIVVATLTSCHPELRGGASLSIDQDGTLLIGICKSMPVSEAWVSISNPEDELLSEVVGRGHQTFQHGEVLTVAENAGGIRFDAVTGIDLEPGNLVDVYVYEAPGEHADTVWGTFRVPREGVETGIWLFPDGSAWDSVCGAYDAQRERVRQYRDSREQ